MRNKGERIVKVTIEVGDYTLSIQDDDSFFLQHESGEGMRLWNNDLAKIFKEYLEKNF